MRPTLLRLAKALEPGQPTGLTGLLTHAAPRTSLIFLYSSTLKKLQKIPEHSPYRQATEALTKKRLAVVESLKPQGYEDWLDRIQQSIATHRKQYPLQTGEQEKGDTWEGRQFVFAQMNSLDDPAPADETEIEEYPEEAFGDGAAEGIRTQEERDIDLLSLTESNIEATHSKLRLEPEPHLTREQYVQPLGESRGNY